MANKVFANGREVACKAGNGKSICAFPDVCMTPPECPATPPGVPIPYPNTGLASDTTEGSKKVQISGKEVTLKNKSYFKKSSGDEAGAATKKGIITSTNRGKVYFNAWSMDVKIEGENVVRHLDLTTHNHASLPGDTLTWPFIDTQNMAADHPCKEAYDNERAACSKHDVRAQSSGRLNRTRTLANQCADPNCQEARRCVLVPHKRGETCCPGQEGDHLVEVNCFTESSGRNVQLPDLTGLGASVDMDTGPQRLEGFENYRESEAPVCCVDPATHRRMQDTRDNIKRRHKGRRKNVPLDSWIGGSELSFWTYGEASAAAAQSHQQEHRQNPKCNQDCTKMQIDAYHHTVVPGATPEAKNSKPVRTQLPRR